MYGTLLFLFLFIAAIAIFFEIRRKSMRIQDAIDAEKTDIATVSHMTANILTFQAGSYTGILAASDIVGILFYRIVKPAGEVLRTQIPLPDITRIDLLINDTPCAFSYTSTQPSPYLRATDFAGVAVAALEKSGDVPLFTLTLTVTHVNGNREEKSLQIPLLRLQPGEAEPTNKQQLLKHAIWWLSFLRESVQEAKKMLQNTEEQSCPISAADLK